MTAAAGSSRVDFAAVDGYIDSHLDSSLADLCRLVAVPSVAAHGLRMDECAALVAKLLKDRGFQTDLVPGGGPPVVIAERGGRASRTLLVYNHYDVQPAEPSSCGPARPSRPRGATASSSGAG